MVYITFTHIPLTKVKLLIVINGVEKQKAPTSCHKAKGRIYNPLAERENNCEISYNPPHFKIHNYKKLSITERLLD